MVIQITITTNASQVGRRMGLKANRLGVATRQANNDVADFVVQRAQFYAPIKSGKLKSGIKKERVASTNKGSTILIRSNAPYSSFQELGTKPSANYGFIRMRGKGRYGEGFMSKFAYSRHPGVKPIRFMSRALEDGRKAAGQIVRNRVRQAIRS